MAGTTKVGYRFAQYFGGLLLAVGAVLGIAGQPAHTDVLRIVFLDVGQGDSIYIQTPGGRTMLVDGGAGDAVVHELGRVVPFFKRHLDWVVATHGDRDHIEGLRHVLDRYRVSYILDTDFAMVDSIDFAYIASVDASGAERFMAHAGQQIVLDHEHGVVIDIVYPETLDIASRDTNDQSIVMVLRYGNFSVLLSGDASAQVEEYLATYVPSMIADVTALKIGHHGSDTSTSPAWLRTVNPEIAVIQAGAGNTFGHPHGVVLQRLHDAGVSWLCTCQTGRIEIQATLERYTVLP